MTFTPDASGDDRTSTPTSQPAWASAGSQPRRHVAKPATVKWGLGILWVGVVLTIVLAVIGGVLLAGVGAQATSAGDGALVGVALGMLVVGLVLVAVQIVLLVFAGRGRNWARIALAVVSGLSLLIGLVGGEGLNFGALLTIVAVVLLFLPASNEWFDAQRGRTA